MPKCQSYIFLNVYISFCFYPPSTFFIHHFYSYTKILTMSPLFPPSIPHITTLIPSFLTPIPHIPTLIPLILTPTRRILTLIFRVPIILTMIPRILTLIPCILIKPIMIPLVLIIPFIPFPVPHYGFYRYPTAR